MDFFFTFLWYCSLLSPPTTRKVFICKFFFSFFVLFTGWLCWTNNILEYSSTLHLSLSHKLQYSHVRIEIILTTFFSVQCLSMSGWLCETAKHRVCGLTCWARLSTPPPSLSPSLLPNSKPSREEINNLSNADYAVSVQHW